MKTTPNLMKPVNIQFPKSPTAMCRIEALVGAAPLYAPSVPMFLDPDRIAPPQGSSFDERARENFLWKSRLYCAKELGVVKEDAGWARDTFTRRRLHAHMAWVEGSLPFIR